METENLSGMFGFDFIEEANGTTYVIECNPRATSGIHLFGNKAPEVTNAFLGYLERPEIFNPISEPVFADSQNLSMLSGS